MNSAAKHHFSCGCGAVVETTPPPSSSVALYVESELLCAEVGSELLCAECALQLVRELRSQLQASKCEPAPAIEPEPVMPEVVAGDLRRFGVRTGAAIDPAAQFGLIDRVDAMSSDLIDVLVDAGAGGVTGIAIEYLGNALNALFAGSKHLSRSWRTKP